MPKTHGVTDQQLRLFPITDTVTTEPFQHGRDHKHITPQPTGPDLSTPVIPISAAPPLTLEQAIPIYIGALAATGHSQHTLKSFELDLRLLRKYLGTMSLQAIQTQQLRQFIAWVRVSRANAPNSLRRKVATLKNFFGYWHDEGLFSSNIADTLPYPEAYLALPEFLEDDAVERLLAAASDNAFWRTVVLLMLDAGLKRDEILALRQADLNLDHSESNNNYLVVRETDAAKRLRSRKLPMTPRLYHTLIEHLPSGPGAIGESRILDISVRGVNFIVETCGRRAAIVTRKPRLTPQVLRETFAVRQMRLRISEERRRTLDGWSEAACQLLALRHDTEVLGLLGLSEDPDTARRYRQLAAVSTADANYLECKG